MWSVISGLFNIGWGFFSSLWSHPLLTLACLALIGVAVWWFGGALIMGAIRGLFTGATALVRRIPTGIAWLMADRRRFIGACAIVFLVVALVLTSSLSPTSRTGTVKSWWQENMPVALGGNPAPVPFTIKGWWGDNMPPWLGGNPAAGTPGSGTTPGGTTPSAPGGSTPGSGGTTPTPGTPGSGGSPAPIPSWQNLFNWDLWDPSQYSAAEKYLEDWNRGYWEAQAITVDRKIDGDWTFIYLLQEPPSPLPVPWTGVMPFAKATLKVTKAMAPFTGDLSIPIVGMTNYPEDGQIKPGTIFYTPVMRGQHRLKLAQDGKIEVIITEISVPVGAHQAMETIKDGGKEAAGTLWNFLKQEEKEWFRKDPLGKNKKP
ncbi:MAG: hypothetical protein WC745_03175 [Patescibacteria group bacterium]|jgi:hypothetical protein